MFTTELEAALRSGRVDLAVHSAKDLPAEMAGDLTIAAVPPRADARDVLVTRGGLSLAALPRGAVVGTSSRRRGMQILHARPDVALASIRGNVDTRLRKVLGEKFATEFTENSESSEKREREEKEMSGDATRDAQPLSSFSESSEFSVNSVAKTDSFDAAVLAMAGLVRVGFDVVCAKYLSPLSLEQCIPAAGQGALAVQAAVGNSRACSLAARLDDADSRAALEAERAVVASLGGDCHSCIAVYVRCVGGAVWEILFLAAKPDFSSPYRTRVTGPSAMAVAVTLMEQLRRDRVDEIVAG